MEKGQLVENLQGTTTGVIDSMWSDNFVFILWDGNSVPTMTPIGDFVIAKDSDNVTLPFEAPAEMPASIEVIQTKKGVKIQEKKTAKTAIPDSELEGLLNIIIKSETKNG